MRLEVRRHCGGDGGNYWLFLCCGGGGDQSSLNLMMKSSISISLWKWFAHSHRLRSWRIIAATAFTSGCVGWGREGRPHASLAIAGLDGHDNCNGNWLSKKRGWTREKERGNLKMGLFFHAVLFCHCFFAFLFQCRLIDFLSRSSQLLDGLLLQDFSFSDSNLVVKLLFIKFKLTVYWLSLARFLFRSSKFGHYISVWQL